MSPPRLTTKLCLCSLKKRCSGCHKRALAGPSEGLSSRVAFPSVASNLLSMPHMRKLIPLFLLGFAIPLLIPMVAWSKAPFVSSGPCACAWDNTTKNYPKDSKTEGLLSTRVRFQCGYLCLDKNGQPHHVLADHEVSYRGKEKGDEVVCEGLLYLSQANPTGEGGRWVNYFWDGVTRSIDARQSESRSLRDWAQASCPSGDTPLPRSAGAVTKEQIDSWRSALGMSSAFPSRGPEKTTATAWEGLLKKVCSATPEQTGFIEGKSLSTRCVSTSKSELNQSFEKLRQQSFKRQPPEKSRELMRDLEEILLCPYFTAKPAPAILKIISERMTDSLSKNVQDKQRLTEFTCTLGLRGLSSKMLPRNIQKLLEP